MSTTLPTDVHTYNHAWKESDNVQFDIQKLDHLWRVLKYGDWERKMGGYWHVSYETSHIVISGGEELDIVGAFKADNIPNVNENFKNTKHATNRMVQRSISTTVRNQALRNNMVYDRQGHYKWKFMSIVHGDRVFFAVNSREETLITIWRD